LSDTLTILISSTCDDFKEERTHIATSLKSLGFNVLLSENDDILYDPRIHTHTNCIRAVQSCDIVIFLVGFRFGGEAVVDVIKEIDLEKLVASGIDLYKDPKNYKVSITQCEILTAIKKNIPIFTFIRAEAHTYHLAYEQNKNIPGALEKFSFPKFKDPSHVTYIFEFFNFLRRRVIGNYKAPFDQSTEIVEIMKKQLSMWFAKLVRDTKPDVIANDTNLEILPASVVGHLSTERQKIFDRLYFNLKKGETIRIMGTGVTSFLGDQARIHGYLKDGYTLEVLIINNNVIKDKLYCTSDVFIENINDSIGNGKVELNSQDLKVHCFLADTNFLIDKNHFNNYHQREKYNEEVAKSVGLIRDYLKDITTKNFKGKIVAKHFRSFAPLSITAIFNDADKKKDLVAEFIIPFTENRIIFHSTNDENSNIFELFMGFFDSTWGKADDII
jgi:hypothetical protein